MSKNAQEIAVLGAGPIGGLVAAHLLNTGQNVTLIDVNREHLDAIKRDGLRVDGIKSMHVHCNKSYTSIAEAAESGEKFDIIYLAVKATVNHHIIDDIPGILADNGVVVCFQNGIDVEKTLLDAVGESRTLRAVVNFAGVMDSPGKIKMTFAVGPNYIGSPRGNDSELEQRAQQIAAALTESGLATEYSKKVREKVWSKVIFNAPLMPVCALTGLNMREAMANQSSRFLAEQLVQEAIEVANKDGCAFGDDYFENTMGKLGKTGAHMPSMAADLLGKRKTEIGFLNQRIAELGSAFGIDVPYNSSMAHLVLSVEIRNSGLVQ